MNFNNIMKILYFFFFSMVQSIKLTVLKTGIFSLPYGFQFLKFHHMVLLEYEKDRIVVDMVPEVLDKPVMKLMFYNKNVPARLRVRKLPEYLLEENIYSFVCNRTNNSSEQFELHSLTLQIFLRRILNWYEFKKHNNTMNLYSRNCQHYRKFIQQQYKIYWSKYL